MNIQDTKQQIIKNVASCISDDHFLSIQNMVQNSLAIHLPSDEASGAIHEVRCAIYKRKLAIGLEDRRPSDDEV